MPVYSTITIIDDRPELADHASLTEAEDFAADAVAEGRACRIMLLLRDCGPDAVPSRPMSRIYGLARGMGREAGGW